MTFAPLRLAVLALLGVAFSGCAEKAQTAGTARKTDGKAWESKATAYDAPGYKPGDKTAWEAQLRTRNAGQNEYAKDR